MADTALLTPEQEEQLKQQQKLIDGLELEKIIAPHSYEHLSKDILVFIPFAKDSEFAPADKYKAAVKSIAQPGIADKYLLLASYAKLAEQYNSRAVLDFTRYTHAGIPEALAQHKDELAALEAKITAAPDKSMLQKAAEQQFAQKLNAITQPIIQENITKNEQQLEEMLRNADTAFANPKQTLGIATPPYVLDIDKNNKHLFPDKQQIFEQAGQDIGKYINEIGSNLDKKNYAAGNRVYVTHFKTVKHEGKDVKTISHIEVYRKKTS